MKNSMFVLLVSFVFALGFSSCGSSMTAEEMAAKVDEMFATQEEALTAEMEEICLENFDNYVSMATDSIVAANTVTEEDI